MGEFERDGDGRYSLLSFKSTKCLLNRGNRCAGALVKRGMPGMTDE